MSEWKTYPEHQPEQGQLCLIATVETRRGTMKGKLAVEITGRRAAEFWKPQPGFHDATYPGFADPDDGGCDYYPDPTHWRPWPEDPTPEQP